ncbi:polysaccharide deacetylase family protein [Oscillibacter sp.]|uniref:polysaccharide deacetylase family protein n=1 Tax=Oscillibacter sp. TaxID=1945593 RepID=UPI0028AA65E2|nr:polysaccharide deacetylase family protein [Oscillibacter sp.]
MNRPRAVFLGIMVAALLFVCREDVAVPATAWAELSETKFVALTFDDGPSDNTTGRLLDGLRERGASATFFLVGSRISGNEKLVRRMRDEGHQIGNHSWDHKELKDMPVAVLGGEIDSTDELLLTVCGEGDYWIRPPYGLLDKGGRGKVSKPLILWSVDPEDWKLRNADKVTAHVMKHVQPGDIILLHDIYPASVDAAFKIIDALEKQGYEFVTVKELLALYGVVPQEGKFYASAR